MADFTPITTQEELNNVIGERLRRERESVSKEFEQKISEKDAEIGQSKTDMEALNKKLEAVNKQLEDANQKISGISALEEKIKGYEVASVKSKIAREVGIPYELAERLSGETEEDIRKDAEGLRKLIGAGKQAPLAGGERDTGKKTDDKIGWTKVLQDLKGEE